MITLFIIEGVILIITDIILITHIILAFIK
jgi:hypothetical protein